MNSHNRRTKWLDLPEAHHGPNAFIQLTEWVNGDGWDVDMETNLGRQHFSIDYELMDALIHLYTARHNLESND